MQDRYARVFGRDDDHGPARRRTERDMLESDAPPDADELMQHGYAGQGYPLYGQPRGLDPHLRSEQPRSEYPPSEHAAPAPRWLADPGAIAYGAGFTPPLISLPMPGGQRGKGPKDYVRADSRIREDVCERLSDDDELDASDISVSVHAGEVILEGTVCDRHDKRRAEDIAGSVRGVIDVRNEMHVKKSFFRELGDKLTGDDAEHRGHHGSGTRNAPAP